MSQPLIEISDVSFNYLNQTALTNVNLTIFKGDFAALIGPNGGGKTTLLKIMLGLFKPDEGSVKVFGRAPSEVAHRIGYVPQNVHINQRFPITVLDVVLMGMLKPGLFRKRSTKQDREKALDVLAQMDMVQHAHRRIGSLSGGQRQRVFIARAIVTNPEILILDEATAGIDTKGQAEFYHLLKDLNKEISIIVVSHDLLVISGFVKSIVCVNQHVHYHNQSELTGDLLESVYSCPVEEICQAELISQHRVPHHLLCNDKECEDV